MDRMNPFAWVLLALLGMSEVAAAQTAALPSTQPAVSQFADAQPGNRQRSSRRSRGNRGENSLAISAADPYAVLRARSIFVKGNQTITSDSAPGRQTDSGLANHPGSALVFNGVIQVGDEDNAMIEDTGSGQVTLVRQGDLIAAGKVSAITFDDLTYEVSGQEKHVALGQNMDGVVPDTTAVTPVAPPAAPVPAPPVGGEPAAAVSPDGDNSPPAVTPPPAPASGASPEEILARMRAKRNQELGIKN